MPFELGVWRYGRNHVLVPVIFPTPTQEHLCSTYTAFLTYVHVVLTIVQTRRNMYTNHWSKYIFTV